MSQFDQTKTHKKVHIPPFTLPKGYSVSRYFLLCTTQPVGCVKNLHPSEEGAQGLSKDVPQVTRIHDTQKIQ